MDYLLLSDVDSTKTTVLDSASRHSAKDFILTCFLLPSLLRCNELFNCLLALTVTIELFFVMVLIFHGIHLLS